MSTSPPSGPPSSEPPPDEPAERDWPPAPEQALNGVALRRLTRQATEAHGGGRIGDLIGEVYSVLIAAAIAWLVVLGAIGALGTTAAAQGSGTEDGSWLGAGVLLLGAGALLGVFARLGPVALGVGHSAWWLPAPADRSGLLRPRAVLMPLAGAVAGLAPGAAAGVLGAQEVTGPAIVLPMALGGLLGAMAALAAMASQIRLGSAAPTPLRPLVLIADAMTVAGPLLALATVLVPPPPLDLARLALWVIPVLGLAAATLTAWCLRGLDRIGGRELRTRAAVSGHAAGSVQSLDTRELGRALSTPPVPRDRRSWSWGWVRGPVGALVGGDAAMMLRSPRHVLQVVVGAAIALIPLAAGSSSGLAAVAFVVGGYLAALATGNGARQGELAPVLDRLYPVGATTVRRVRVLWPLIVLLPWCAVIFGVWGVVFGDVLGWLTLGLLAAPALAAGVLRAAYRRPPDWSRPLAPGPGGPIPPGVISAFSRGPDVVVICLIPLFVAALATGPGSVLLFVQAAMSAIALSIACYVPQADSPGAPGPGGAKAASTARRT